MSLGPVTPLPVLLALPTLWRRLLAVAILAFAPTGPAMAQAYVDTDALDQLFLELRFAADEASARQLANQIWMVWTAPDEPRLAQLMALAGGAQAQGAVDRAFGFLNIAINRWPDYAEAWNQRATLYFMLGRYEDSLADCAEVLAREPRHFGALSGQAVILLRLGRDDEARQSILAALALHPYLQERTLFPGLLPPPARI